MSFDAPSYDDLVNMMAGHAPPAIPATEEDRRELSDEYLLSASHYWRIYDLRLESSYPDRHQWFQLLAGVVPLAFWNARRDLEEWLRVSGAWKRLALPEDND